MTEQLHLFVEPEANGNGRNGRAGALPHGAPGLLKALVQQGLAEDAFEVAAALCLLLDEGANGHS